MRFCVTTLFFREFVTSFPSCLPLWDSETRPLGPGFVGQIRKSENRGYAGLWPHITVVQLSLHYGQGNASLCEFLPSRAFGNDQERE